CPRRSRTVDGLRDDERLSPELPEDLPAGATRRGGIVGRRHHRDQVDPAPPPPDHGRDGVAAGTDPYGVARGLHVHARYDTIAAPTWKPEYGAYARSRASPARRTASSIFA